MPDTRSLDLEQFTPRQAAQYAADESIVETFGKMGQDSGPDGAHYVAESPFAADGLVCANCAFYEGPRGCEVVNGDIDPAGICKRWIIPATLVAAPAARSASPAYTQPRTDLRSATATTDPDPVIVDNGDNRSESRAYAFEYETRDGGSDGLTLEGYAAVFDQPANIVDWRGQYVETIQRGAFKKTLQENRPTTMLHEHGRHPLIGRLPIAEVQRLREDSRGLHFRARMFPNWLTEPVRDAIRGGGIQHMSLEMYVLHDTWSADRTQRSIQEINRVPEISTVLNPAYDGTSLSLRSLRSLSSLVDNDEMRSAYEAAFGTSGHAPEPHPEHSVITTPETTMAAYLRMVSRRMAG